MMFFKQTTLVCALALSQFVFADSSYDVPSSDNSYKKECWHKRSPFHAIVASGYAWSMDADIRGVDTDFWAPSDTGYNAKLGNSPFITLGFGYRLFHMLDIDFGYTLYDEFEYQKNQTDPFGNKRTRFFDLNHQSSLFNFTLSPYPFSFAKIEISPLIGLGLGVGTSKVSDFQTVFYDPLLQGIGLTTSIGVNRTTNAFAWQGMGGFRIHPKASKLNLDIAYRYYNGGTFKTPPSVIDYNGLGQGEVDSSDPWKGTLQTNQFYFAINFSI